MKHEAVIPKVLTYTHPTLSCVVTFLPRPLSIERDFR